MCPLVVFCFLQTLARVAFLPIACSVLQVIMKIVFFPMEQGILWRFELANILSYKMSTWSEVTNSGTTSGCIMVNDWHCSIPLGLRNADEKTKHHHFQCVQHHYKPIFSPPLIATPWYQSTRDKHPLSKSIFSDLLNCLISASIEVSSWKIPICSMDIYSPSTTVISFISFALDNATIAQLLMFFHVGYSVMVINCQLSI